MHWSCSDLKVKVAGEKLSAHKFVLAARSDVWSLANLASTSELDLSGEQLLVHLTEKGVTSSKMRK